MAALDKYRAILRKVMAEYASGDQENGNVRTELVIDETQNHFEVICVGWQGDERVHHTVLHVDIINGKLWIQVNNTDRKIGEELVEAGVRREDIVLGFHPAKLRQYTEFAVG